MAELGRAALAGITLVLLTAGCLQLGGVSPDDRPAEEETGEGVAATTEQEASIVPGSAELGLAWTQQRWGSDDEVHLVDETRTVQAPADVHVAGHESTWLGSAQVFRPDPGRFVLPGSTTVEVTVDWQTRPDGAPLQGDLLVGTAEENPSWLGDPHERVRDIQPGDTITLPVSAEAWDDPYQDGSLWWFGLDLDGDPISAPVEVDIHLQASAHREGEIPKTLVAHDPWQGTDRIELLNRSDRANDILVDGHGSSRLYHCPNRCDGLAWAPPGGALVPEETDRVRATIRWSGDLPSRPVLGWVVEPDAAGPMRLVDEGDRYRTFETEVPDGLVDSKWQNRTAWRFTADLETAGQDPDAYTGSMTLTAEAIRSAAEDEPVAHATPASPTDPTSHGVGPVAAWSAGITAVGFVLWLVTKLRWSSGLSALYSRIPDDEVLENERRRRILALVTDEPGIHFRELRRHLETGGGVLEHHIRKLVDADLVEAQYTESRRCFFPKGRFDRVERRALARLKAAGARRIARAIARRPEASLSEIAEAADLAVSTASHHVQRLEEVEVVRAEWAGNAKRLQLTSLGDGLLAHL